MNKLLAWLAIALSVFFTGPVPLSAGFGGTDLILPAVGRIDGVAGSHFYTTIWITNPSPAESADFEASFLRGGQSNPSPVLFHGTIAPGATKSYEDAAVSMFGVNGVVGAVRVRSARPLLAFRAGYTNGGGWDDANIGHGSFAAGARNSASGLYSLVFGSNNISSGRSSGAFGDFNTVSAIDSYAFGNLNNIAGNNTLVNGSNNTATSGATSGSTALGISHTLSATQSFAIGERATITNSRAMVISLGSSFGVPTNDAGANTLTVRAANGIYLGTNTGTPVITGGHFIETSTGAFLTSGGSWTNSSDRNLKENFLDVDGEAVLQKLASMPITTWNYRAESKKTRHLGPMAQDFAAAFHLGDSDRSISTVDEGGVALAAAQALAARTSAQQQRIEALEQENSELRQRLDRIEKLLTDNPRK